MTKAAFATWNNRIAPVFDVARWIELVETESGRIIRKTKVKAAGDIPNLRASGLADLGVNTLVCGAISRPLKATIAAYGIEVISFVAGDLQEVIQAWLDGKLPGAVYAMPGCPNAGRRRIRGTHGSDGRDHNMNGNKRGKQGAGQGLGRQGRGKGGQGQGRGGRGQGSGYGTSANADTCVCPKCGHQAPHQRGVPCMQQKCAQCGASMTRQ